jgi:hypothetical protein
MRPVIFHPPLVRLGLEATIMHTNPAPISFFRGASLEIMIEVRAFKKTEPGLSTHDIQDIGRDLST